MTQRGVEAAQRRSVLGELQRQHKLVDFLQILRHDEAQHGAVAIFAEHPVRQLLLGIGRQAGVIDPADVLVGSQRRRQFFRRVHGLRHPDRGGVDAPMDEPGAEGVTGGTQ